MISQSRRTRTAERVDIDLEAAASFGRQHLVRIDVAGERHELKLALGEIDDGATLERQHVPFARRDRRRWIGGVRVDRQVAELVVNRRPRRRHRHPGAAARRYRLERDQLPRAGQALPRQLELARPAASGAERGGLVHRLGASRWGKRPRRAGADGCHDHGADHGRGNGCRLAGAPRAHQNLSPNTIGKYPALVDRFVGSVVPLGRGFTVVGLMVLPHT